MPPEQAIEERLRHVEVEVAIIKQAVENHIPSAITAVRAEIAEYRAELSAFRKQFWAGVVLLLTVGIGINVWIVQELIKSGVVLR